MGSRADDDLRDYLQALWEGGTGETTMSGISANALPAAPAVDAPSALRTSLSADIAVGHFDVVRLQRRFGRVRRKLGWELAVDAQEGVCTLADPKRHHYSFSLAAVEHYGWSSRGPNAVYFTVAAGAQTTTYHAQFEAQQEAERFVEMLSAVPASPAAAAAGAGAAPDSESDSDSGGEGEGGEESEGESGSDVDDPAADEEFADDDPAQPPPAIAHHRRVSQLPLLENEVVMCDMPHASRRVADAGGDLTLDGQLRVTNYRLLFSSAHAKWSLQVPLGAVAGVAREGGATGARVVVQCKDVRTLTLELASREVAQSLLEVLAQSANPPEASLFCFSGRGNPEAAAWAVYSPAEDLARMGAFSTPARQRYWRLLTNEGFRLCATYPREVLIPSRLSEPVVMRAAAFRSKRRLPVVSWMHAGKGNVLARSAQPLVGLQLNRSSADEQLLELYHHASSQVEPSLALRPLCVFDARRVVASAGNRMMGKGVETKTHYRGARIVHLGMHNIHEVRRSFAALAALVAPGGIADNDKAWLSRLEETGWLKHAQRVLAGSMRIAKVLQRGSSAIVHCSDGWDRTPQLSATAQLLVDPHYRTLRGFMQLVEKEWCSFGHKFRDRTGTGLAAGELEGERSPVFVQWLDVVWQVLRQAPAAFEFGEALLLHVADAALSGRYGTFVANCEAERAAIGVAERTHSCWEPVLAAPERFTHAGYTGPAPLVGVVSSAMKKMVLWEGYWMRWDPSC